MRLSDMRIRPIRPIRPWIFASVASIVFCLGFACGCGGQPINSSGQRFIGVTVSFTFGNGGGAMIDSIEPGGPADQAGLRPGDVVTAINGFVVDRGPTLTRIVSSMAQNETARLTVVRGAGSSNVQRTIPVVVASSPKASEPATPPGARAGATRETSVRFAGRGRSLDPV
jgi:membrane-associated protease RseP (regulator of RpoE activity)